jgi:hypothetical protein
MKINPVPLTKFTLPRLYSFCNHVVELVNKQTATKLKIQIQFETMFIPAFDKFDEAYSQTKSSELTHRITELGKKRDRAISAMNGIVRVFSKDIDLALQEYARKVTIVLSSHKELTRKPMNEQTAEVTNMLQILKSKYSQALTKLNMDKWIIELERVNTELNTLVGERYEESADKRKVNTEEARKELINAYRYIVKTIDVLMYSEGEENYSDFVRNLNAIIIGYGGGSKSSSKQDKPEILEVEKPVEEKYPTAREWTQMVDVDDFKLGDICFVVVEGVKKYYEMIDTFHFDLQPDGEEGHLGWKPVE